LPLADHIIILGEDGKIAEQGSWEDLRAEAGYISQVILKEKHDELDRHRDDAPGEKILSAAAKKSNENFQDLTRKTGDITLYSTG
jgi:ATP-binding cassette, subfamily C (CFTR/MRP), member 1